MKKALFIICILAVLLCVVVGCILKYQEELIVKLEDQIQYLEEDFTPVKFEIVDKNSSSMRVKIKYYDINGKSCGSSDIKLEGSELGFDVEAVEFENGRYIFFPRGVYTASMKIADEVKICQDYGKDGFPLIYRGMKMFGDDGKPLDKAGEAQVNEQLKTYYNIVCKGLGAVETEQHGVSVHELKSISEFKKGSVYKVMCHPYKGGVEIVKDK